MTEPSPIRVEELTGLYGPVFLEEKQIQRIWATRGFRGSGMVTRSGRRIEILDPGRWNFQEGPDFRGAVLELDGRRVHGDVEIHLHEADWRRHGHGRDPNFRNVVLHVVLFPDRNVARPPDDGGGGRFETLEWLKYLSSDLESYLEDQGVDRLLDDDLPPALAELLEMPLETRESVLLRAASERWARKRAVAEKRLLAGARAEVFHQAFLEILGLKRNRALMSRIAVEEPLVHWADDPGGTARRTFEGNRSEWRLAGCRPANHPRRRLETYAGWIEERGADWPNAIPRRASPTGAFRDELCSRPPRISLRRRELGLARWEKRWRAFFAPAAGGTRFNTWVADGLLPLLTGADGGDRFLPWFLWAAGDIPDPMSRALRLIEVVGPGRPLCNGWAQGVLRVLEPDYSGGGSG